jgi:uncharacterized Zn finger protein
MEELSKFVDDRYIKRGREIVAEGSVGLEHIKTDSLTAYAIGTAFYIIEIQRHATGITGTCSCPAFIDFGPCKHIAAAVLARLDSHYMPSDFYYEQKELFDMMTKSLMKKSKEELIFFIFRLGNYDPEVMRFIEDECNDESDAD